MIFNGRAGRPYHTGHHSLTCPVCIINILRDNRRPPNKAVGICPLSCLIEILDGNRPCNKKKYATDNTKYRNLNNYIKV